MERETNWLSSYLEYTKPLESPTSYHIWSGISIVAACLRRVVWCDIGFEVYPNLYIVLVGPPGRCRKTVAINTATKLTAKLQDVKLSADAITREALIQAIKGSEEMLTLMSGVYTHSSLTVISKELSVFLGTGNHDLLSLLTDLYDCIDDVSEILTNNGWKTINTISMNDLVLTMNTTTQILEYKPINFIVKKDVNKLVKFKSRAVSQVITPKHRVLYKYRNIGVISKKFKFKEAEEFVGTETEIKIPLCGHTNLPDILLPDAVIALTAWSITEGTTNPGVSVDISQDERRIGEIIGLLDGINAEYTIRQTYKMGDIRNGYKANYNGYRVYIKVGTPFFSYIAQKGIINKYMQMSERQFNLFLYTLISGDGTHISDTNKNFTTIDKRLVDRLQELSVRNGWACYYSEYNRNNKIVYQMSFNKKELTGLSGGSYRAKEKRRQIVEGPAKVWCVNNDNGTMVIRRDGKVSITGNCADHWEYRTKGSGIDTIYGAWLNVLGASTPAWLVGSMPLTAIGGGFTSRVIFVVEDNVRHKNAFPRLDKKLRDSLSRDLETISMMRGEFKLTPAAIEMFESWYNKKSNETITDARFSGYVERKHVHLIKTAMVLSACDAQANGMIEEIHINQALQFLTDIEDNMVRAFGAAGRSPIAADIDTILNAIRGARRIEKEQLIGVIAMDVHPKEIDIVCDTLSRMGHIKIIQDVVKMKTFYEPVEKKK